MIDTFTNSQILVNKTWILGSVLVENGIILDILPEIRTGEKCVDLHGNYLLPGFIDIHTHGGYGYDVNNSSAEDLLRIGRFFASHGVTAWNASILTDSKEKTLSCITNIVAASNSNSDSAQLLGVHLEGPFLATEYKGAMPEEYLKKADLNLFKEYYDTAKGLLRYITVSPEVDGVIELTKQIKELIPVAVGHTGADYLTTSACLQAGAEAATHTANAMLLLHQHEPGAFGALMEAEDITCEVICDGRHLHPAVVRLLLKWKGVDNIILITDSIQATGLPDGKYRLGINDVIVKNGDAKLPTGVRAGSTLTLDEGFRKFVQYTGLPLEEAVCTVTSNPARLMRIFDNKGSIQPGKDADFTILDNQLFVQATYVRGKCIYSAII